MLLHKIKRRNLETAVLSMHVWHAIELVFVLSLEALHTIVNIV